MSRRGWLVLLLILLGTTLRFARLDHQSLWWDEAWQYHVCAVDGMSEMLDRLLDPRVTASPPASHVITHLFLKIGRSDAMVRLPSVLLGILTLPMVYVLGRRLIGGRAAVFAVAVMAFSPYHVHYSQEARMYALLMFVAVTATWLFLRAVERGRFVDWALYAVAVSVGIYTHVWSSMGVLSHAIWTLITARRQLLRFALSGVAAVVSFSPMIRFFLARVGLQQVPQGGAGSVLAALPYVLFVYAVGFSLGPSVFALREDRSLATLGPHLPVIVLVMLLFGMLLVVGLGTLFRNRPSSSSLLVTLGLVVPVLGVFAASFIPSMTFNVRYTSWGFPFFALVTGAALECLLRTRTRLGASLLAAVAALFAVSLVNHYTNDVYAKEDVRAAVSAWRAEDEGGAFFSYYGFPTADRYMTDAEIERHYPIWRRGRTVERIRDVVDETGNRRDAFVLLARDWRGVVETFTRRDFEVVDEWQFRGGVRLLRISFDDTTALPG